MICMLRRRPTWSGSMRTQGVAVAFISIIYVAPRPTFQGVPPLDRPARRAFLDDEDLPRPRSRRERERVRSPTSGSRNCDIAARLLHHEDGEEPAPALAACDRAVFVSCAS
jgi:hypothetical protein